METKSTIRGICVGLAIVFLIVGYYAQAGYVFSHEIESYDAVFEIVDANETAVYTQNVGTTIYHTLSIRNVNNFSESYNVDVTSWEYHQCGVGRLAIFNVKIVETIFGEMSAIVTFQSME